MKVLAAVSGGVDSAVAMARVAEMGHDVTAVHLALSSDPQASREGSRGCCTISDANDARRAADVVDVPFYVWDVADEFRDRVIEGFIAEYAAGHTPNPCIRCNEHIKFAAVLEKAVALGFDAVVTGHYAQLTQSENGPVLRRAADNSKDQSYVLAVLGPDRLRRCLFPLGDTLKSDVRLEAKARGLTVANKPDSHDICFIPDGDTEGFLAGQLGERPGPIIDLETGEQLGEHRGTYGFTIGQRKGMGIDTPTKSGRPRYVLKIEPVANAVVVGDHEHLRVQRISAQGATWVAPVPPAGAEAKVQIRAHGQAVPAVVDAADEDSFRMRVHGDLFALAAGQSCVLYVGDRVLGQGTVAAVSASAPDPLPS